MEEKAAMWPGGGKCPPDIKKQEQYTELEHELESEKEQEEKQKQNMNKNRKMRKPQNSLRIPGCSS